MADEWAVIINQDKTWVQHLTNNRNMKSQDNQVIYTNLKYNKVEKISGMLVDFSDLTMKHRIEYLESDFSHRLNIMNVIFSTKWGASSNVLRKLYKLIQGLCYIDPKEPHSSILYSLDHFRFEGFGPSTNHAAEVSLGSM